MAQKPKSNWKRRFFRVLGSSAAMLAATQWAVTPVQANVGTELNDFFNDMGGAGNAYGPTAFEGQAAGYYTGGGAWTRFPTKDVNPVNVQLPSLKAGCGGIDIFGGSFSFINTDEIVATLKAVASNSLGFAFQLAIKSISPQISQTVEEMAQKIEKFNQMSINSCETAQGLVAGLWGEKQGKDSEVCRAIANSQGWASDWAKARQECDVAAEREKMMADNDDPTIQSKSNNYTWQMLNASYPGFSREFKEYLMTLVGTIVYKRPTDDTTSGGVSYYGYGDRDLITALLDGNSSARVLRCDTVTECLNPSSSGSVGITEAQALKPRIAALITSMAAKVRTDTALSAEEIGILGGSSIPLYKIISVNAAAQLGGMNRGEIESLAEIVAIDMVDQIVREFYGTVVKGQGAFHNADNVTLGQWRQQINEVRDVLDGYTYSMNERLVRTQAIVDRTVFLERTLRNAISPQLGAALSFSSTATAHGLK